MRNYNMEKLSMMSVKKIRTFGGRKSKAVEVRENLFQWFIDVKINLKVQLPWSLFRLQHNKFFEDWLKENPNTVDEDKLKLQFSNQ